MGNLFSMDTLRFAVEALGCDGRRLHETDEREKSSVPRTVARTRVSEGNVEDHAVVAKTPWLSADKEEKENLGAPMQIPFLFPASAAKKTPFVSADKEMTEMKTPVPMQASFFSPGSAFPVGSGGRAPKAVPAAQPARAGAWGAGPLSFS